MSRGTPKRNHTGSYQEPSKKKILLIEDDEVAQMVIKMVLEKNYEVDLACDGEAGLEFMQQTRPDLVLVDWMLPGMDGIDVVQRVRQAPSLRHVPMIFVTARKKVADRIRGLSTGADDYICKPFEYDELLARVAANLARSERDLDANPLTRLPGNMAIYHELNRRLVHADPFAVCYLDLDRFKVYNDHYGFERGDHVIRDVAEILRQVSGEQGDPESFVGHIGGDDFLIITALERADDVCSAAVSAFDARAPRWYVKSDRDRGHILAVDRRGTEELVPLMTLSIGVVPCHPEMMRHPAQIGQIGAELKRLAKSQPGSLFITDRRSYVRQTSA